MLPAGSGVAKAYVHGDPAVAPFYNGRWTAGADYDAKAAEVDGRFGREEREAAVAALTVPPGGDAERLTRFVDEGGYMVTTGQQPGLFGGPLYSLFKAVTAVRLAEALEERLGKPVLPVFWVASEDHDWEEANHTHLIDVDNELRTFSLEAPSDLRPPLHRVPIGDDVESQRFAFLEALPPSDFRDGYAERITSAWREGATLPEAFSATLQSLLGPLGLYFTDAAQPALKERSRGVLTAEVTGAEELEAGLRETAERLEGDGFSLQVPILEGGVNLFVDGDGGRERLYREGDDFVLRGSGARLSRDEVLAKIEQPGPGEVSPNVLLRPVVESAVFPTLVYVAGPGEIAYFAQLRGFFEAHGVGMPIVHPRWGATLVEAKIAKVLDKFGVEVADLDRPFHEIAGERARDEVPGELRAALGKLRGAIGQSTGELQGLTRAVDPTLKGPVQHMRSQTMAAVDDLEKKIVQAVKRETDIALQQLEKAQVHLFPHGKPAERVQNPFYFLARYGDDFIRQLYESFGVTID